MNKALSVWWDEGLVGTLSLDPHGDLSFAYAQSWLADPGRPAISAFLPRQSEPFSRRATRPFFAGLLPEEGQREGAARILGISPGNDFRLLEALGGDVAGALTLWPEGEAPPAHHTSSQARPLDGDALAGILDDLPRRPLLAGREGMRLSLAGAQPKLPVVLVDGVIALPAPGQPTTHILKPPMARLEGITQNEAFVMNLAAALGLKVAPARAWVVRDRPFLLVERYDRTLDRDGHVRRLHQEDFCQALGYAPENKYAGDGGPGFRACFDLVRDVCTAPAPAVLALADAAIFNVIVGNADAHSKNFSLLYRSGGVTLAPLYDLLCTVAYPDVSPNLAMRVGRRQTLDDFRADTWAIFAADVGIGAPYLRRRVARLARDALTHAPIVADAIVGSGFTRESLAPLVEIVARRADRLLGQAG